jgi:hypothetical protein
MHALDRDRMPVIAEDYLHQVMAPCILLALPNPALFMAGESDTEKLTGDRPRWSTSGRDHSGVWLRNAAAGLCLLATAAAVVSFTAQYRLIQATRRLAVVAGLEAAIPDAAALVFACLGIALALHGRRAIRARALRAAWWPILTVRAVLPLPRIRISRACRSRSLRAGSSGWQQIPVSSDRRMPVAVNTAMIAASRRAANDRRRTGAQAPAPVLPDQPSPADPGMIPLTVPETGRLLGAPAPTRQRQALAGLAAPSPGLFTLVPPANTTGPPR